MASVVVNGDTSGAVTLSAPAVAGTVTVTLPSTSGTMAVLPTATGVLAESAGGTGTTTGYYGFKNRIINGAMVIDQRNAGAEVNPAANGVYYLDRWQVTSSAASKFKIGQNAGAVTPPTGYINYLGCTSLSAYTVGSGEAFTVRQKIEGLNVADLAWGTASAATVTFSFWVYSSLTGTFGGAIKNSAENRSYPFSYTISAANTWEQKTVTLAGDTTGTWLTTNGAGLIANFSLGAGATVSGTASAWAAANYSSATGAVSVVGTNGATFYITGVQLEKGSTATSFDYRPYGTELALCQRYYYQIANGANGQIGAGYYYGTTQVQVWVKFAVSMRAAPVISTVTGTNYYKIEPTSGGIDTFNSFAINLPTTEGALVYNASEVSGTSNLLGQVYTNNASAFLAFSSEL